MHSLGTISTQFTRFFLRQTAADRLRSLPPCRSITNRNPFDFSPEDHSIQAAFFGTDEFTQQQQYGGQVEEAKGAALKLLSSRSHSRKELKAKLLERGHPLDSVAKALDRLEVVGLQSDAEFAEVFARSKWRQTKWGPSRIKSELKHRGVDVKHIQAALRSVFGEEGLDVRRFIEERADEGLDHISVAAPEAALLQAARDQYERSKGLAEEARKRRLAGWLSRRGHAWSDVARVMRRIETEEEEAAAGTARYKEDGG